MKIGFDVDGVLAYFDKEYRKVMIAVTGKNLFTPDPSTGPEMGPATWDWDLDCGYTKEEVSATWNAIRNDPTFWERLAPLTGAETLSMCIPQMEQEHDLYFITSRSATSSAKKQTENWLRNYVGVQTPTVLISSDKDLSIAALRLDAYIDDNLPNVQKCAGIVAMEAFLAKQEKRAPKFATRVYLLNKNYNQAGPEATMGITRVRSVGQFLDYELTGVGAYDRG